MVNSKKHDKRLLEVGRTEKQHSHFAISVNTQKNFQKLYQWCVRLSTEQGEEDYVWTWDAVQLANRLITTRGNLVAVIGLQGSGKTALRQALWARLLEHNKKVLCFKWGSLNPELLNLDYDIEDILTRLMNTFNEYELARKLKINPTTLELLQKGELTPQEEKTLKPLILKLASREERREIERCALLDAIQTNDVILIDFPDYSKTNQAQMVRDLDKFAKWWESLVAADTENIYTHNVNLVVFFQKELFSGHFLFGKFDVFELKPMDSLLLMQIMKRNCGGIEPFTVEALKYLAGLSRGIIRFKKYVKICLEKSFQHGYCSISPDLAKQWIGIEQLEKDMELELMDIFPRQRELRRLSIIVLQLLNEKKAIPQNDLAEEVFDGNKVRCSRLLDKLEAWGYISREWESTKEARRKIVRLRGVC